MDKYTVTVWLQFPSMPAPYRVRVTPRELIFLDLYTERSPMPCGRNVYLLPADMRRGDATGARRDRHAALAGAR